MLFLDAPDDVLIRRFSETRRRHPLSGSNVREGLLAERIVAGAAAPGGHHRHRHPRPHRARAARRWCSSATGAAEATLAVTVLSFGFKYGLPMEADIVLDVRFLPNPFFVEGAVAR